MPIGSTRKPPSEAALGFSTWARTNSLLGINNAPGAKFTLWATSTVTGLNDSVDMFAIVGSTVTIGVYNQCQSVPQDDPACPISAAGPAPDGTT